MAFETMHNSGALFKNDKTEGNPSWPDYKGTINIDGRDYWLSAWLKKAKSGATYMGLQEKPKEAQAVNKAPPEDPNDQIPF